jgi:DNA-3-methyladenine glycosylase
MHDSASTAVISSDWCSRSSLELAPDLIGCTLVRQWPDGTQVRGVIVETEAYEPGDPACHAYRGMTERNRVMFGPAGFVYVYLIYGMYHCLNIVSDYPNIASAVLIRALELETTPPQLPSKMTGNKNQSPTRLAAGPGKLCRVLEIDRSLNGTLLQQGQPLWLEQRTPAWQQQFDQGLHPLTQTTRIGLTQGVDLPWRWYLRDSQAVSKR